MGFARLSRNAHFCCGAKISGLVRRNKCLAERNVERVPPSLGELWRIKLTGFRELQPSGLSFYKLFPGLVCLHLHFFLRQKSLELSPAKWESCLNNFLLGPSIEDNGLVPKGLPVGWRFF